MPFGPMTEMHYPRIQAHTLVCALFVAVPHPFSTDGEPIFQIHTISTGNDCPGHAHARPGGDKCLFTQAASINRLLYPDM